MRVKTAFGPSEMVSTAVKSVFEGLNALFTGVKMTFDVWKVPSTRVKMTFDPSEMVFTAVESVFEGSNALFTAV